MSRKLYFYKLHIIVSFIAFLICLNYFLNKSEINGKFTQKKIIFSFWEPRDKMPGYIKLCIKTWKKFLPEYEIKILDYKSLKHYIGESLFSKIIYKNISFQTQSDAIRVALLKIYGGIWFDADTIITNGNFLKKLKNYELVMLGVDKNSEQNIAFIFASANSSIINKWLNLIINKINYFKQISDDPKNSWILKKCCLLGNKLIDPILRNITNKKYFRLDRNKMNAIPEDNLEKFSSNRIENYRLFYFQKGEIKKILDIVEGIILLQNSYTPLKYQLMSEKEFLKQDIVLSKLFQKILYEKN